MNVRDFRSGWLVAGVTLNIVGVALLSGCGSQQDDASTETDVLSERAREVAKVWDESAGAASYREGYYPMAETTQLPVGGFRTEGDKRAYNNRNIVLAGELPDSESKNGEVQWSGGGSATLPLVSASDSYERLSGPESDGASRLTVTGAKLGKMEVITSRGPATVSAWLFSLEGYDTPLKQAAVATSKAPESPIKPDRSIAGHPLNRIANVSRDTRSVSVVALHGSCDDGVEVDVWETKASVVMASTVKNSGGDGNCTKQAKMQRVTVSLKSPLEGRAILDARTARPVPYKG
ncbi:MULTISPECIES: hypothetical protein [Streptomyces]|uniref:Lipoprotein n=1 Tax=Streptomyces koyangensis TaxID=188770 RepID=A0A385DD19_9ACTN|nr:MULTISPECIES: hypothetical protein [Streptomyces]AXQ55804.1 hypothetical protein D0C37_15125 [Streptomyces koyangensis]PKR47118.1 hypothetical protein CWE27_01130 [Streptomyces sp. EAG2]WTD04246.1 hypothetical protein OH717_17575 [Streptomyces albidoflavus]